MSKDNLSFSQNLSVDCSYVSSTWLRRPDLFGRAARLTLTVCDGFTTHFPFVVQRGLPTDIFFGSDWCAYRRDVAVHHNVRCPCQSWSSATVRESWPVLIKFGLIGKSNGSSIAASSDASQAGS
jgi:hypothetical protein